MALTKLDKNLLGFSDDTDFIKLPSGTTAQRPSSAAAGQFRFNTTIGDVEAYNGTAWKRMGTSPPTFTSVDYPGNDTALDPAGGQSLVINGTVFNTNVTVKIGGTTPSSITRNSATQITVNTPAKAAGTYTILIENTDGGTATASNAVSYNGIPAFTNAAGSLGSVNSGDTVSLSAVAAEPDGGAIGYTITSGSLPSGVSINASTGAITGTAPTVSASTTSSFTVTATDNENQSTARAYSITVTPQLPSNHFGIVTYAGNSSTRSITGVGFKPDWVWIKRTDGTENHYIQDSTRGSTKQIYANLNSAEYNETSAIASFDNDGFSMGNYNGINNNGENYIAYCWKGNGGTTSSNTAGTITSTVQANPTLGFSILKWTGTGAQGTLGHGLSSAPDMVISKRLNATNNWNVYHKNLGFSHSTVPNWLYLNHNSSEQNSGSAANHPYYQTPSSTLLYQNTGTSETSNVSGGEYISYCFKNTDGFSKFGGYTGNGNANGPIIETGFEPAFIMVKRTNATSNWVIYDNNRNTKNPRYSYLLANENSASTGSAGDASPQLDFFSNGFRPSGTEGYVNASGHSYIYMAFANNADTTAPTLANSFDAVTYSGSGSPLAVNNGFKTSLLWAKARNVGHHWGVADALRGINKSFMLNEPNAQTSTSGHGIQTFGATTTTLPGSQSQFNTSGSNYIGYFWKGDDNEPTIGMGGAESVYKFEDNVTDTAGNHNGANAVALTYTSSGKFNKAIVSNGTNSEVSLSQTPPMTSAWTFSFWFYATDAGSTIRVILQTGTGFAIGFEQNKIYIFTGGSNRGSGTSISLNTWHHYVATYNGTNVKTYLNGSLAETITTLTGMSAGNLKLFDSPYGSWAHYQGRLDQLRVYYSAVTDSTVADLYAETTSDNNDTALGGSPVSIIDANPNAGFSVIKYSGKGGVQKIPHGLNSAPEFIIIKKITGSQNWNVGHEGIGWTKYLEINTNAPGTETTVWNNTAPDSTVVTLGGSNNTNASGHEYVMYCWHSVTGYSKIGTYTGTNPYVSTNNSIVTGFQPDFLIVKSTSSGNSWNVYDSPRSAKGLYAQLSNSEINAGHMQFDSNGFTMLTDNHNYYPNGGTAATMVYMAIKIN
jgi:hypothetical protein